MKLSITKTDFLESLNNHTHIPVYTEISGDLDTPVGIYLKIKDMSKYSFLLESALQGGSGGRYSFVGFDPAEVIKFAGKKLYIIKNGNTAVVDANPIDYLRKLLNNYKIPKINGMNFFSGGLVGYFAYDIIRMFEDIPDSNQNDLNTDDFILLLMETVIVYDHYLHTIRVTTLAECSDNPETNYDKAVEKLENITKILTTGPASYDYNKKAESLEKLNIRSNFTKQEFENMVVSAKEHIRAGDIFQIVLSQRFSIPVTNGSFGIYRSLRRLNPSPYMYYLALDDTFIAGSSPEVLVKSSGGLVTMRPLAGTRKRGSSPSEDKLIAKDLLDDEKERAEHIMLVDLGRNDLGRISKYGSIHIPEFMGVEYYSHVMHIVSEVRGKADAGKDSFDIFESCFPAGTVSGAPKIRAMQLIDELENCRRGIYAGAIGHFDFYNNMDTCIGIRTIVIKNGVAYIQAGAGIVADSIPENEYLETLNKAGAMIAAVADAEGKIYDPDNR